MFRCQVCGSDLGQGAGGLCPQCAHEDRSCLRCGYSLRSLRRDGRCPECGLPVEDSLRGNLLRFSSPAYLARLHLGVILAELAVASVLLIIIAWVVVLVIGWRPTGLSGSLLLLPLVYTALSVAGWWLLSSPDPALVGREERGRGRRVVRVLLVFVGLSMAGLAALGVVGGSIWVVPGLVGRGSVARAVLIAVCSVGAVVSWLAMSFCSMRYLLGLARRFPDERLRKSARDVSIGVVLLPVLAYGPRIAWGVLRAGGWTRSWISPGVSLIGTGLAVMLGLGLVAMYGNLLRRMRGLLDEALAGARDPIVGKPVG